MVVADVVDVVIDVVDVLVEVEGEDVVEVVWGLKISPLTPTVQFLQLTENF